MDDPVCHWLVQQVWDAGSDSAEAYFPTVVSQGGGEITTHAEGISEMFHRLAEELFEIIFATANFFAGVCFGELGEIVVGVRVGTYDVAGTSQVEQFGGADGDTLSMVGDSCVVFFDGVP